MVETFDDIQRGFALLRYHDHEEFIFQTQSNLLPRVMARLSTDNKVLMTHLLRRAGFPVPNDIITDSVDEAQAFLAAHDRVVIKPIDNSGGKGVTPGIKTPKQLQDAIPFAVSQNMVPSGRFVCQEHLDGRDFRILVVNRTHLFACERVHAAITGDGQKTAQQLIEDHNAQAVAGYEMNISEQVAVLLAEQGSALNAVVPTGQRLQVARVANSHAGGRVVDATDDIGEEAREIALRFTAHFGYPIVGIDIISPDIKTSFGKIIEINACPAIYKHHYPDEGKPQNIASPWLDMLFPETAK